MAILLDEPSADDCVAALLADENVLISAGTVAETLVVSARQRIGREASRLVEDFGFIVVPVTAGSARQIAAGYERWGRGVHPAALNFGDCFAYAVAKEHACPLLYVGNDFSQTDIESVL